MNKEIIFIIEDSLDGGFEARSLNYSIFTEAETYEELKNNIKESLSIHFDAEEMPKLIRLHYIREEVIAA